MRVCMCIYIYHIYIIYVYISYIYIIYIYTVCLFDVPQPSHEVDSSPWRILFAFPIKVGCESREALLRRSVEAYWVESYKMGKQRDCGTVVFLGPVTIRHSGNIMTAAIQSPPVAGAGEIWSPGCLNPVVLPMNPYAFRSRNSGGGSWGPAMLVKPLESQ